MKLTRGNTYHITDEEGDVIIATVTKNTSYNNRPALFWKLYYRDYPRNIEITINGRKEEYISNNWGDNYVVKQVFEQDIPHLIVQTVFETMKNKRIVIK